MKRSHLKEYFVNFYSGNLFPPDRKLIREQEEEGGGLFDDPEEEKEDDAEEEGEDEGGEEGDDAGEDEKPAEEKAEPELSTKEYTQFGSSVSQELTSVFDEFAAGAMKTDLAKSEDFEDPEDDILPESFKRILLEKEGDGFDMSHFSSEVARLIKNYQNLLDMEALIFVQAKEYLIKRFDDETKVEEFEEYMSDRHNLDLKKPEREGDKFAAGSTTSAGGG